MVQIKLELGLDATRMIQQVQIHNQQIEAEIAKGIELAIQDLFEAGNFSEIVREATKQQIADTVIKVASGFQIKNRINELITQKISEKVEAYADQIADKITESLR